MLNMDFKVNMYLWRHLEVWGAWKIFAPAGAHKVTKLSEHYFQIFEIYFLLLKILSCFKLIQCPSFLVCVFIVEDINFVKPLQIVNVARRCKNSKN